MKSTSIQASIVIALASSSTAFTNPSFFGISKNSIPSLVNNYDQLSQSTTSLFARRGPKQYQKVVKVPTPPMNDEIDPVELRVAVPNPPSKDEPLGIMHRDEALAKAKEMGGLDLILVNPHSDPPVAKIASWSKYRYQQEKKAKEVKKNSKATEIKEVKMSYKIDVHDYDVRKKSALKFLNQGNRVKCTVMFRGREVQHEKLGFELLDKLAADLDDLCVREGRAKREGRNMSLIISPRPEVLKRVGEIRRAEEKAKKKLKNEKKEQKLAAVGSSGAETEFSATRANGDEDDDDEDDIESDIESSLDDLFGKDGGLGDDLFA